MIVKIINDKYPVNGLLTVIKENDLISEYKNVPIDSENINLMKESLILIPLSFITFYYFL